MENGILCLEKSETTQSLTILAKTLQDSLTVEISEMGEKAIAIFLNRYLSQIRYLWMIIERLVTSITLQHMFI